jgi:Zn-dependent peptidase ImmA (M78 family)
MLPISILDPTARPWAQSTRRRRSGAFAAELLLPVSGLERASAGHLDNMTDEKFMALLRNYGVGARTAAYQLYNHKLLSRPTRDDLIAVHGKEQ